MFKKKYFTTNDPLTWQCAFDGNYKSQFVASYFTNKEITSTTAVMNHNGVIKYQLPSAAFTITDGRFHDFLLSRIPIGERVQFDMDKVLGIGGQSIVLRARGNTCVKLTPIRGMIKGWNRGEEDFDDLFNRLGMNNRVLVKYDSAYGRKEFKELAANSLSHDNIIVYSDHSFEVIDDVLFHLTGTGSS